MLLAQPGSIRSVYVISDLQKNMAGKALKADSSVAINLIQLKAAALSNVAVDSVWLLSAVHRPGENEKLVVRLHNYSTEKADKVPVKVVINGAQKALGSYTILAGAVQNDTLAFMGLQAGWQQGKVELQDNPVTFDNQFYFSFNVSNQMPVLLIDGGTPNTYLKAVLASDPFFNTQRVPDGNVNYTGLNSFPMVIMSDVKAISTGLAQQLKTYVAKGGTLMVFPDAAADLTNYRSFLQPMNASWPEKLITGDLKVAALNKQSPVFKNVFESFPENPDLPVVKKYYQLAPSPAGQDNLMKLTGGQTFWAGYTSGRGRVYVAAVPLDEDFSNLPRHALFVPVMFRIALLSGHDLPLFYILGQDETLEIPPVQVTEKQLLKLVKSNQSTIPDVRQQEGSTVLYLSDQLRETGIYTLKKQDSTLAMLAFNDNRTESDMSYLSGAELKKLMPKSTTLLTGSNASLKGIVTETNFGTQLWKLCIILALTFLAAEILLIRYFKPEKQSIKQPV